MQSDPTLILLAPANHDYARRIVRGVRDAIQPGRSLIQHVVVVRDMVQLQHSLEHLSPCGIIAFAAKEDWEDAVLNTKLPAINVSGRLQETRLPRVMTHNHDAGEACAEHLHQKGFLHQAFIHKASLPIVHARHAGWLQYITDNVLTGFGFHQHTPGLLQKLLDLPRPLGIACGYDTYARPILDELMSHPFNIPQDIAIMGIDNEEDICECGAIPLTSVPNNGEMVGKTAFSLLQDQLLYGTIPPIKTLVAPGEVVERASTSTFARASPEITLALNFIQAHALKLISIDEVVEASGLSKATLYRRFQYEIGYPPHAEIRRIRINHAKSLLKCTDLSIKQIARNCGYPHANHFSAAFKKATGMTPGQYRTSE